jgi:WD40 repeat protein
MFETGIKVFSRLPEAPEIFSSSKSIIRKSFGLEAPGDITVTTQVPDEWNACIQTLEGHSGSVHSVVFSRDGSRLASGSGDKTVRVWDVQTGQCQHTLEGHSDGVGSVVFSRDGSRLASGSWDCTVRVWDVITSTELMCYETATYGYSIEFSDDSTKITVNGDLLSVPSQTRVASTAAGSLRPSLNLPASKLSITGEWVTLSSERILWLPPEYRPGGWASKGNTITIGSGTGRVTIVGYAATHYSPI